MIHFVLKQPSSNIYTANKHSYQKTKTKKRSVNFFPKFLNHQGCTYYRVREIKKKKKKEIS